MIYLEIIVKAELASRLSSFNCKSTGSEVIVELTGRVSAVKAAESHVTLHSCSIPHDARTFQQINQYIIQVNQ